MSGEYFCGGNSQKFAIQNNSLELLDVSEFVPQLQEQNRYMIYRASSANISKSSDISFDFKLKRPVVPSELFMLL